MLRFRLEATRPLRAVLVTVVLLTSGGCCATLERLVDHSRLIAPGPHEMRLPELSWHTVRTIRTAVLDGSRQREIPLTIYVPEGAHGPLPLVLFSHGIGEDRDSYAYLGHAWAAHGFLAVHLTHHGTDRAVLEQGYWRLYRATKQPENWRNRPLDTSYVIDALIAGIRDVPAIDVARIASAGHSAGAFTSLALAGLHGGQESLADKRVRVALALSMPKLGALVPPDAYDSIGIPVLHMTGTCDGSLIYRTKPADRRIPFERTRRSDQYLVTVAGLNHDAFSARSDPRQPLIARISTAFLQAFLLGDPAARAWFDEGGLSTFGAGTIAVEH